MTIIRQNFTISENLKKEIEAVDHLYSENISRSRELSIEDFIAPQLNEGFHGLEFVDCVSLLTPNSRILDIGVGRGETSLYLALQGHSVSVVEPVPLFCNFIDEMAQKRNLSVTVYQATIEEAVITGKFDACIFNASLHHCDDPINAIKKCHDLLNEGGRLFVLNEQLLKIYKSKKTYYRLLTENPGKVEHYGGNEHIYRHSEYYSMLKNNLGSEIIQKVPCYYLKPKIILRQYVNYKHNSGYEPPDFEIVLRAFWYYFVSKLVRNRLSLSLLRKCSCVITSFIAVKSSSAPCN